MLGIGNRLHGDPTPNGREDSRGIVIPKSVGVLIAATYPLSTLVPRARR